MPTSASGGARARWGKPNWFQMMLDMLDPRLEQPDLERLHQPIESAIAMARERCEDAGLNASEDLRDIVWEEESDYTEELLGVAFVICQARLTRVATRVIALHDGADDAGKRLSVVALPPGRGERKRSVFEAHSALVLNTKYTHIQAINAYANYFKHHDEWIGTWAKIDGSAKTTIAIITATGASQGCTGNLRTGAKALGITSYDDLSPLRAIVEKWHASLCDALETDLRAAGLIR